jgi:rubrerythrin
MALTLREIIGAAIGIEEAGYEFYTRIRDIFDDPSVKDTFDFLAREELVHKEIFRSLLHPEDIDVTVQEERSTYLASIIGTPVFGAGKMDPEKILPHLNGPRDAVKHALTAEKESILFYTEMKDLNPSDRKTISLLDGIIAEERNHVVTLVDLSQKLRLI